MRNKKVIIIVTGLSVIAVIFILVFVNSSDLKQNQLNDTTRPVNTVDYGPSTGDEKEAANNQKENNVDRTITDSKPAPSTANVFVVDSSQYGQIIEVRGYVSNLFENGGTCTARFSKGGYNDIVKSVPASTSASTTQCQTIEIPIGEFGAKGEWNFTLEYTSASAKGASSNTTITVR